MTRTVRLEGLSVAVSPRDLRLHFAGLEIPEGGVTIIGGARGVAYLSFNTWQDARRAVELSGCGIKDSTVYVFPSSTAEMEESLLKYSSRNGNHEDRSLDKRDSRYYDKDNHYSFTSRHERKRHPSRSPDRFYRSSFRDSRSPRWQSRSPQRYSRSQHDYNRSPRWHSRSPLSHSRSPGLHSQSPHVKSRSPRRRMRSPKSPSNEHDPIYDGDFHVHVTNLNYTTKKEDLRRWFFNLVSNDHIKFLYDEKGRRTRECFVVFTNEKDYKQVLKLDKVAFKGRLLFISSISKLSVRNILTGKKVLFSHHHSKGKCVYLRNFPSDVTKSDIQKFFPGFSLNEEDISLLCDRKGVGLGEVMVSFSSEEDLEKAEKLHRKKFKDREIPLRRIPEDKLESFLSANSVNLMPDDPNDCVTQEDDLTDEDIEQEEDRPDENVEDNIQDEDSGFHQTDNAHESVTQADDDSPVQVDKAPSTECMTSESSIHVDHGKAIEEDATSNDGDVGQ